VAYRRGTGVEVRLSDRSPLDFSFAGIARCG
jgi:hypothetical protein